MGLTDAVLSGLIEADALPLSEFTGQVVAGGVYGLGKRQLAPVRDHQLGQAGADIIDLGMGNPMDPAPQIVIDKLCEAARDPRNHRYSAVRGIKGLRKEVVKNLSLYDGMYRYIPVLASFKGFKVNEIPVKHHKRKYGKSKYGFERLFRGSFDLITVIFLRKNMSSQKKEKIYVIKKRLD